MSADAGTGAHGGSPRTSACATTDASLPRNRAPRRDRGVAWGGRVVKPSRVSEGSAVNGRKQAKKRNAGSGGRGGSRLRTTGGFNNGWNGRWARLPHATGWITRPGPGPFRQKFIAEIHVRRCSWRTRNVYALSSPGPSIRSETEGANLVRASTAGQKHGAALHSSAPSPDYLLSLTPCSIRERRFGCCQPPEHPTC